MTIRIDRKTASLNELVNRLTAAMQKRIIAEVRGRAAGQPVDAQKLAKAEQTVCRAVERSVQRKTMDPSATICLSLAKNKLTAGLVQRSQSAVIAKIRKNLISRLPQGRLLQEVVEGLARGEAVDEEKVAAARSVLYNLTAKEASPAGVPPYLLKGFDNSLTPALIAAFPELELERVNFNRLNWSTEALGIANVRHQVFHHNPGLAEELAAAERRLNDREPLSLAELRELNAFRLKLEGLITIANLDSWNLGGSRENNYFPDLYTLIAKSFPLTAHPLLRDFVGEYYFRDPADLGRAYEQLKARSNRCTDEYIFNEMRDQPIQATVREKYTLAGILEAYARLIGEHCRIRSLTGPRFAPEKVFELFLAAVVDRQAQPQITAQLHDIRRSLGFLNENLVRTNVSRISWLSVYGAGLFSLLFGLSIDRYLHTPEFWAAGGKKR